MVVDGGVAEGGGQGRLLPRIGLAEVSPRYKAARALPDSQSTKYLISVL